MPAESLPCPYCAVSTSHDRHRFRERMFGLEGQFSYLSCSVCGVMRIEETPTNLDAYYPDDYYSFNQPLTLDYKKSLKWRILQVRDRFEWTGEGPIGKLLSRLKPNPQPRELWPLRLRRSDRILDVGSGSGHWLSTLRSLGFTHLHGVDPYVPAEIHEGDFWIRKMALTDLTGAYDAIMIHHALEHMEHHEAILAKCRELLAPAGRLLIRIPTVSCEAWDKYGEDWYQLDAPRHLTLHSRKSFEELVARAGFRIAKLVDDSTPNQFVFSELYRLGLPLAPRTDEARRQIEEAKAKMPMAEFERETARLNREGRGDQISALLLLA